MQNSLLDNDLYKFTMQQAVLDHYPEATAKYEFINRRLEDTFSQRVLNRLHDGIHDNLANLNLTTNEFEWLGTNCPYFTPTYLNYLANYEFEPDEVDFKIDDDGQLHVSIEGPWHKTILWEVPLMAIISEAYFAEIKTLTHADHNELAKRTFHKGIMLSERGCVFADFGTRRRFSYDTQFNAIVELIKSHDAFVGTSNVSLAKEFGIKPIGTMAHEWIMGVSALEGLRHANRHALEGWSNAYNGDLGIALTDTYGSEAFFNDFDLYLSKLYDGVRHDSGDPYKFIERVISHYESWNIDPMTKTIVFSDGLNPEAAVAIKNRCHNQGINCSFGIGTNFTNDVPGVRPLNMVIKLREIDDVPVCKLSDEPGKVSGDPNAIAEALWVFQNVPFPPAM